MKLHLLDMPEETAALADWLARALASDRLGELVAELSAVATFRPPDTAVAGADLATLLGGKLPEVLNHGLRGLSRAELRRLLGQPQVLLDLQERVLVDGGDYWRQLLQDDPGLTAATNRVRERLEMAGVLPSPTTHVWSAARPAWVSSPFAVGLATAALLLLAVLFWPTQPTSTAWGWNAPGALPQDVSSAAYLRQLAEAADAWFKQRPTDAAGVAKRIAEFRQGCSVLLLSEHRPLNEDQRSWLRANCRRWALQLDEHLRDVEAGRDPQSVRESVDDLVRRLRTTLQTAAG